MDEGQGMAEQMEPRILLSSVARTSGTLRVYGDAGVDNVIVVGFDATKDNVVVTVNGATQSVVSKDLKRVRIFGDSGNDRIHRQHPGDVRHPDLGLRRRR